MNVDESCVSIVPGLCLIMFCSPPRPSPPHRWANSWPNRIVTSHQKGETFSPTVAPTSKRPCEGGSSTKWAGDAGTSERFFNHSRPLSLSHSSLRTHLLHRSIPHAALLFVIDLFPVHCKIHVHVCRPDIGSLQYLNSLLPPLFLSSLKFLHPTSIFCSLLFLPASLYFFPGLLVSVLLLVWFVGVSLMSFSADVVLGWSRRLSNCPFFSIIECIQPTDYDNYICRCLLISSSASVVLCRPSSSAEMSVPLNHRVYSVYTLFSLHIMTLYLPLSADVVVCWGRRLLMPLSADFVLCRCRRPLQVQSSAQMTFFYFYWINECILSTDYDTI
jgi:hypothetical protein